MLSVPWAPEGQAWGRPELHRSWTPGLGPGGEEGAGGRGDPQATLGRRGDSPPNVADLGQRPA